MVNMLMGSRVCWNQSQAVEGSFPSLANAFGSPNPASLAAKIRDIESQMLEGKLVLLDDARKPLKPKSVYEHVNAVGAAALSKNYNP